jgi:AraC-like DNA-binding protein
MSTIGPIIAGMTIGLDILLIILIYRRLGNSALGLWLIAFILCVTAATLKPHIEDIAPVSLIAIIALFGNATAAAFFGFCQTLFADQPRLRPWQIAYVIFSMVLAYGYFLQQTFKFSVFSDPAVNTLVFFYAAEAMKIGLILLALTIIVRHSHADLVEQRIKFRKRFLIAISIYFAVRQTMELIYGLDFPADIALLTLSMTYLLSLMLGLWLLELRLSPLAVEEKQAVTTDIAPAAIKQEETKDLAVVEQLDALMRDKKTYTEHGLTVAALAGMLNVREYKLRRLINQHLGFRNFNHYLHKYRIEEAGRRLQDPENTLPILSIALDVGYSSINPFNRAFKDAMGETPSNFRKSSRA